MLDVETDIVRVNPQPKTEVNYIAQLMSGVRDPNDALSKDKGKPYSTADYSDITKYINAKITPTKKIFEMLQEGFDTFKPEDFEAQQNYLHNANIFIKQLILNDPYNGIEFNKSLK